VWGRSGGNAVRVLRSAISSILLLVSFASAARALNPFYLSAKLGDAQTDIEAGSSFPGIAAGDAQALSLGVGLKLGKILVVQAEYQDLGNVAGTGSVCPDPGSPCIALAVPIEVDTTAVSFSLLPHLALTERVHAYGKVGFVSWSSELSAVERVGEEFFDDFDDEDLVYGAGLRLLLPGPVDVFGEYEEIADRFETISIGATFGF